MCDVIKFLQREKEAALSRRAHVDENLLNQVLEAGTVAPTGDHFRTVQLIPVKNRETLQDLSQMREETADALNAAAAAVIVLKDMAKSSLWGEDTSSAMGYMLLKADRLGLKKKWISFDKLDEPEDDMIDQALHNKFMFSDRMKPIGILSLG